MLKRDLSYELSLRELQALDELFSREPEDWAEWAGSTRDRCTTKREPSSGGATPKGGSKPVRKTSYTSFSEFWVHGFSNYFKTFARIVPCRPGTEETMTKPENIPWII